ncbi:MAG TPA: 3-deoxy-7-phosphoheptulonate synthase, partial [Chryseosolibacter sp.]|nr:3-deoxy-7-phosphoheptulonate synthase [Chryseosolibacter sp.]
MIIQLSPTISSTEKQEIIARVKLLDYKTTEVRTQKGDYLVAIGKKEFDIRQIGSMRGILDIHRVSDDYKLVSRKWKVGRTSIDLGDGVIVGDGAFSIMAGPCSIENEKQVDLTINHLRDNGVRIMRGGVFKPRSSP